MNRLARHLQLSLVFSKTLCWLLLPLEQVLEMLRQAGVLSQDAAPPSKTK